MSTDEAGESYSDDLEISGEATEQAKPDDSYESDYDEQETAVVGEEEAEQADEELVEDEGRTSEPGSQAANGMDTAADREEEDFYEEEVVDEEQRSERAAASPPTTPPTAASPAGPAPAAKAQAEAEDSYSDDAEEDASLSTQVAGAGRSQVQQETAKYLQMLQSGQLKLPTVEKKEQAPAGAKRSSRHGQLSIRDMVSPAIASHIFSRGSKLLTPGPGAYEPAMDRFGKFSSCSSTLPRQQSAVLTKSTFGTARQRPRHVCIPHPPVVSPGPVYLPQKNVSTLSDIPRLSFPRQEVGSRFTLSASMPANCPHWNPGPGHYRARTIYKGGVLDPNDAPRYGFPQDTKSPDSVARLTATRLIYESKANAAVSPCSYNPDPSLTKPSTNAFSLAEKAPSYFDAFLDPGQQPSPGPVYSAHHLDGRGKRIWGDDPRATFGRSKKEWEPELNLSATCFISKVHAHHSNQTLHSPGPVYYPQQAQHAQTPLLASGPADRFYDRFEPGRIM